MKLRIVPYKMESKSAKLLADKLTEKVGYKVFRSLLPKPKSTNIIWGSRIELNDSSSKYINQPLHVSRARDKAEAFYLFGLMNVPHPSYTTEEEVAKGWLSEGKTILARSPTGQGGSGITVLRPNDAFVTAPLYTVYVKKRKEFRVHVINGEVVYVQQKRKKVGQQPDPMIRSHSRGWVFCVKDIEEPNDLREVAVKAVQSLDLNFGAVDVIWNAHQNKCYVLEVNTAPGLCPTTSEIYASNLLNSGRLGSSGGNPTDSSELFFVGETEG